MNENLCTRCTVHHLLPEAGHEIRSTEPVLIPAWRCGQHLVAWAGFAVELVFVLPIDTPAGTVIDGPHGHRFAVHPMRRRCPPRFVRESIAVAADRGRIPAEVAIRDAWVRRDFTRYRARLLRLLAGPDGAKVRDWLEAHRRSA